MIPSFRQKLGPLAPFLADPEITEIVVNRPGELWIARQGARAMQRHALPELTPALLESLARLTAEYTDQTVSEENPLLSATIPVDLSPEARARGGYRIQFVLPPAAQTIGLCIRKPALLNIGLDWYVERRVLSADTAARLSAAVKAKQTIVLSGGMNTGKTLLLNALLKAIPADERLVTIEDAAEIAPPHPNVMRLFYSRGGQGVNVSPIDLLMGCWRLCVDRILFGELRGPEAFAWLEAVYSGHPGSLTTIHANSPAQMWDRLALMVMRAGTTLKKPEIVEYAKGVVGVVVQLGRDATGRRYIEDIWEGNAYEAADCRIAVGTRR